MADKIWNTGVYEIRHVKSGKRYVGSTGVGFKYRFNGHKKDLEKNKHRNRHLQFAWNKYGKEEFLFLILERCSPDDCVRREQFWIDKLQVCNDKIGYNLSPVAGSVKGLKWGNESKQRITEALRKYYASDPEHRKAVSARMKKVMESPEIRAKVVKAHTGRKHTLQSRMNVSASLKGKPKSEKHRLAIKRAKQNMTAETRARMSEAARRKPPISEETRMKMSLAAQKRPAISQETRAKLRVAGQMGAIAKQQNRGKSHA